MTRAGRPRNSEIRAARQDPRFLRAVDASDASRDPFWRELAACRNHDPELFFPQPNDPRAYIDAAREVCAGCPVQDSCLAYALNVRARDGIFGGTEERERRPMQVAWLELPTRTAAS